MTTPEIITSFVVSYHEEPKTLYGINYTEFTFKVTLMTNGTNEYVISASVNKLANLYLMISEDENPRSLLITSWKKKDKEPVYEMVFYIDHSDIDSKNATDELPYPMMELKSIGTDLDQINSYYQKYIGAELMSTKSEIDYICPNNFIIPEIEKDTGFSDSVCIYYNYWQGMYHACQIVTSKGTLEFVPQHGTMCGYTYLTCVHHLPTFIVKEKGITTYDKLITPYCEYCGCASGMPTPEAYCDEEYVKKVIESRFNAQNKVAVE